MPSLMDFYRAPSGTPAPFIQANTATQSGLAETEAGVQTQRTLRNFSQRSLPQLASQEAASGRFYSGGAQQRAGWLAEDTSDTAGDIQRRLGGLLADLTRNGVMAQLGVSI